MSTHTASDITKLHAYAFEKVVVAIAAVRELERLAPGAFTAALDTLEHASELLAAQRPALRVCCPAT